MNYSDDSERRGKIFNALRELALLTLVYVYDVTCYIVFFKQLLHCVFLEKQYDVASFYIDPRMLCAVGLLMDAGCFRYVAYNPPPL